MKGPPIGLVVVLAITIVFFGLRNVPPETKLSGKTNHPGGYITNWETHVPTNWEKLTISELYKPTNFLTIEDCVFVTVNGSLIVNLTGAQWNIVTNHYAEHLRTNDLSFSR